MDNFVYDAINGYFDVLSKTGYYNRKDTRSLMALLFYYNLIYYDYRGYISESNYKLIEKALNCLYGTNCLIPYPDYLKMGKLRLGDMTEVISRTKALEEYSEELNKRVLDNDVLIEDNIKRLDEYGVRLDSDDRHLSIIDSRLDSDESTLASHGETLENHEGRLTTIENTKVVKGKNTIQNIPDIDLSQFDVVID